MKIELIEEEKEEVKEAPSTISSRRMLFEEKKFNNY